MKGRSGYDNIDLHAAAQRAVTITNTPGVLDDAVADLAMGLLLGSVGRIAEGDRFIRSGTAWTCGPRDFVGLNVSAGAVLGIVGLGRIGMAVVRRAQAFGMRILADQYRAGPVGGRGSTCGRAGERTPSRSRSRRA